MGRVLKETGEVGMVAEGFNVFPSALAFTWTRAFPSGPAYFRCKLVVVYASAYDDRRPPRPHATFFVYMGTCYGLLHTMRGELHVDPTLESMKPATLGTTAAPRGRLRPEMSTALALYLRHVQRMIDHCFVPRVLSCNQGSKSFRRSH